MRMRRWEATQAVVSVFMVLVVCNCGIGVRYTIDEEYSWIAIVPGVWPENPLIDPITEGSFALNVLPVVEQVPESLQVNVTGYIEGELTLVGLNLNSGSRIEALTHPHSPFEPSATAEPRATDNLAGLVGPSITAAVRGAVADLIDGVIRIDEPADYGFKFIEGVLDYSTVVSNDSVDLTTLLVTSTVSEENVTGSFDGQLTIPILVNQEFTVCLRDPCPTENNSRFQFGGVLVAHRENSPKTLGDFNGDGLLTLADINLLSVATVKDDQTLDMNNDDRVDQVDINTWITLFGTLPGDINLDRMVAFGDFLGLSANFGSEGVWGDGNFDTDGVVGFADFLALSTNFGDVVPNAEIVPESSVDVLAFVMLWFFWKTKQRRTSHSCSEAVICKGHSHHGVWFGRMSWAERRLPAFPNADQP